MQQIKWIRLFMNDEKTNSKNESIDVESQEREGSNTNPNLKIKIVKLMISCSGIYFIYLFYGLFQEKIFATDYKLPDSSTTYKFRESSIIVLLQSLLSFFLAFFIKKFKFKTNQNSISKIDQIKLGIFNEISMMGSVSALKYVSYPVQALMKSAKILSVMLVTFLIGGKKHTKLEYICACLITVGILIFNLLGSSKKHNDSDNSSIIGLILLVVSLFSDGMLAETQRKIRHSSPLANSMINTYDMMEATNFYCFIFSLIYCCFSLEILFFTHIFNCDILLLFYLIAISVMGTIGQLFIFYTITAFGPIVLSVITTTRKFFTVLCSIVIFEHNMNFFQWFSVLFVFTGVGVETIQSIKVKKEGKAMKG